jgi:hypothetical protein
MKQYAVKQVDVDTSSFDGIPRNNNQENNHFRERMYVSDTIIPLINICH